MIPEIPHSISKIRKAATGKKMSFISGIFNVLHPGHLRFIRFAKECSDILVIGIQSGESSSSAISFAERKEAVASLPWVDFTFELSGPIEESIRLLKPDFVVKGKEFEIRHNPEESVLKEYGGRILFSSGESYLSFHSGMQDYFKKNDHTVRSQEAFLKRHNFNLADLYQITSQFAGLEVVVVGDSIVDEYISCEALGMSQEDPTIVVSPTTSNKYIGGASIVAAHAAGLGASVKFFSVVGSDENKSFLEEKLKRYGVEYHLLEDESRPTTFKQRFRADKKTLLRVNQIKSHSISKDYQAQIIEKVMNKINDADLIIFSDFNYGCLPQTMVEDLIHEAKKREIVIAADSQCSSQIGDITRFKGVDFVSPTEREARVALKDHESGLPILAQKIQEQMKCKHVIITLGADGLILHNQNVPGSEDDRLPAFGREAVDPSGAGDSFLCCGSMAYTISKDIYKSVFLGSVAAACQVSELGNRPLLRNKINKFLR